VTEKDRVVRNLAAAIDERRNTFVVLRRRNPCRLRNRNAQRLQTNFVARINPMRILELRVVRPQARPLVRILEEAVADVPERVALLDDVRARHLCAGTESYGTALRSAEKHGSVFVTVRGAAATFALTKIEMIFLITRDRMRRRRARRVSTADDLSFRRRR